MVYRRGRGVSAVGPSLPFPFSRYKATKQRPSRKKPRGPGHSSCPCRHFQLCVQNEQGGAGADSETMRSTGHFSLNSNEVKLEVTLVCPDTFQVFRSHPQLVMLQRHHSWLSICIWTVQLSCTHSNPQMLDPGSIVYCISKSPGETAR